MKTEYYIVHKGAGKVAGPFSTQDEAENNLGKYPEGKLFPVYNLTEEEAQLRERSPLAHAFRVTFFVLLLCGIIGWAIYGIFQTYEKYNTTKNWVPTPACLTIDNIHKTLYNGTVTEAKVTGSFVYEVGGKEYTSSAMGVYEKEDVLAFMEDTEYYRVEQSVTCYVNPANPEDAVLFNNTEGGTLTYGLCGVGILVGIGGLVSLRRKCKKRAFLLTLDMR